MNQANPTDMECLLYPDLLHKHIDMQLSVIGDRIKNVKLLIQYLQELA